MRPLSAHDYKGDTVSTIGEERAFKPHLQVKSFDEYVDLMTKLNLPNPKMTDVAIPSNWRQGLAQEIIAQRGWSLGASQAVEIGHTNIALIDLRENTEHEKHGVIPGSLHAPYPEPTGEQSAGRRAARARGGDARSLLKKHPFDSPTSLN